jgi:hypothetical protein
MMDSTFEDGIRQIEHMIGLAQAKGWSSAADKLMDAVVSLRWYDNRDREIMRRAREAAMQLDQRVAYGYKCTWWGPIQEVGTKGPHGLPCCPQCQGNLLEVPDLETWWDMADANERENWREFIFWLKGKCFHSEEPWLDAMEQFTYATGKMVGDR